MRISICSRPTESWASRKVSWLYRFPGCNTRREHARPPSARLCVMAALALVTGPAGSGKTERLIQRAAERYEADRFASTLVLVPTARHGDQFRPPTRLTLRSRARPRCPHPRALHAKIRPAPTCRPTRSPRSCCGESRASERRAGRLNDSSRSPRLRDCTSLSARPSGSSSRPASKAASYVARHGAPRAPTTSRWPTFTRPIALPSTTTAGVIPAKQLQSLRTRSSRRRTCRASSWSIRSSC